jgi:hypothetical protein
MREHVKIVAILNIVLGSLGACAGIVILILGGSIAAYVGQYVADQDATAAAPIIAAIAVALAIFFFLLSLPSIIGGWGLLHFRPWARILMIIISAINLLHVPIGTAVGIYGLWVLLSEEGHRLFETGGRYVPPPGPQPPVYLGQTKYPAQSDDPHQPPPGI